MFDGIMSLFGGDGMDFDMAQKIIMGFSAVNSAGKLMQGLQTKRYYSHQQAQALADANAVEEVGQVNAERTRKAGNIVREQARGAYGGSGVSADSKTAQAVDEYIARNAGEDALLQLYAGRREAAVKRGAAAGYGAQGEQAMAGGLLSSGQSLLSGAIQASNSARAVNKWIKKYQPEQDYTGFAE